MKVEGRSKSEVARDYKISRCWVQQLVTRYEAEGDAAFWPRSRRPHSNPHAVSLDLEDQIVRLRKSLPNKGLDAGAETIRAHLQTQGLARLPSTSTIWRILTRRGFITPEPRKRPKGAGNPFCAEMPNERWQADTTHWQLADGTGVEILNIIDEHSRLDLVSKARQTTTGPDVLTTFRAAFRRYGIPASVLTDNGAIFTGTPRHGGRVALEIELDLLGVRLHHSRPYHPQTCGKASSGSTRPRRSGSPRNRHRSPLADLQRQLDRFRRYYNTMRPHRAIDRRTPEHAYAARPKARPTKPPIPVHYRVRRDRIDPSGVITLRYDSQLRHIGLGREHARKRVLALVADRYVRVVDAETGELLPELTLNPTRDYQPLGRPPGPRPKTA